MNEIFHDKNVLGRSEVLRNEQRVFTEDVLLSESSRHVQHVGMYTGLISSYDRSNGYVREENLTSFFTARYKGALK
jgi:hypothetical protein